MFYLKIQYSSLLKYIWKKTILVAIARITLYHLLTEQRHLKMGFSVSFKFLIFFLLRSNLQ